MEFFQLLFPYLFELNISPGILIEKNEEKKYVFDWGSNPQKYYFGAIYRAEIEKCFRSVFSSSENCRICFRD